ncbi:prefoldin subunit 2-like [Schistocerca gregaria]|uniref:prefoldin subunit 2-like n=1 Tax=Schistocerca gregaria TaxID=7010 RepID=UPI00211F39F1|nr:prefoldin subunit 2-like [Schistocerca gregaria]
MAEERKKPRDNDVVEKYRDMIAERRYLGAKLAEMEMDLEEHRLVTETLKGVDSSRKCYRMVGGILCQLTVKDVLPILATNAEQLVKFIEDVTDDVKGKDKEIKAYRQQFSGDLKEQDHSAGEITDGPRHRAGGVLVGKS